MQGWAGGKKLGKLLSGRQDLLEVVEQQQEGLVTNGLLQCDEQRAGASFPQPQRLSDGWKHKVGVADGCQWNKQDAACEVRKQLTRHCKPQARFADPSRSGKREQAYLGLAQQGGKLRKFALASQLRGQRHW